MKFYSELEMLAKRVKELEKKFEDHKKLGGFCPHTEV